MSAHDMNVVQQKCCSRLPFLAFTALRSQSCKTACVLDPSLYYDLQHDIPVVVLLLSFILVNTFACRTFPEAFIFFLLQDAHFC